MTVRRNDLPAVPPAALIARNPAVDWATIDDVILGCANQPGEDNRNVAHMASLLAGLPDSISGTTMNRFCGSGMDAIGTAARMAYPGHRTLWAKPMKRFQVPEMHHSGILA